VKKKYFVKGRKKEREKEVEWKSERKGDSIHLCMSKEEENVPFKIKNKKVELNIKLFLFLV